MDIRKRFTVVIAVAAVVAVGGLATTGHSMSHGKDIVDTAVAAGTFNTLAMALTEAGLIDT